MPKIAKKDFEMISESMKKYQPILEDAVKRDINKSDTIVIVNDMLEDVFGFNKYHDITNDFYITTTFCDLAVMIDKKLSILMDVKPVGLSLKYEHITKARKHAVAKDIEYVILTNAVQWQIYDCNPDKALDKEPILQFDLRELDSDEKTDVKKVFALHQKGIKRSIAKQYKEREEILNKHTVGALMLSDKFVSTLKKELQKLNSNHYYDKEEVKYLLQREILKRDIVENKEMGKALKRIKDANYTINKRPKTTRPIKSPNKILSDGSSNNQYKS